MVKRWGQQWGRGIVYSPQHSSLKPWRVKFQRKGHTIRIGDYPNLRLARTAADSFLRNPSHARL